MRYYRVCVSRCQQNIFRTRLHLDGQQKDVIRFGIVWWCSCYPQSNAADDDVFCGVLFPKSENTLCFIVGFAVCFCQTQLPSVCMCCVMVCEMWVPVLHSSFISLCLSVVCLANTKPRIKWKRRQHNTDNYAIVIGIMKHSWMLHRYCPGICHKCCVSFCCRTMFGAKWKDEVGLRALLVLCVLSVFIAAAPGEA